MLSEEDRVDETRVKTAWPGVDTRLSRTPPSQPHLAEEEWHPSPAPEGLSENRSAPDRCLNPMKEVLDLAEDFVFTDSGFSTANEFPGRTGCAIISKILLTMEALL